MRSPPAILSPGGPFQINIMKELPLSEAEALHLIEWTATTDMSLEFFLKLMSKYAKAKGMYCIRGADISQDTIRGIFERVKAAPNP